MGTRTGRRGLLRRVLGGDVLLGMLLLGAIGLGVALLEQQALALETENLRLEQRIKDLDDPMTIELLARSQQGLVRPGEVPYVLIAPEVEAPRIRDAPEELAAEEDILDRVLAWIRSRLG